MKFPVLAAILLLAAPAHGDGCDELTSALLKGLHTPWRATVTLTVHGDPRETVELVTVAQKAFSRRKGGTWKLKSLDPDANEAQIRRDWAGGRCQSGGTGTIGNEAADIVLHGMNARFWISQATGLILKTETSNKPAVLITVYDYNNVQEPTD